MVAGIGITGHGHEAPATHLEALRRFSFDTVLTPWNYVLSKREDFSAAYHELAAEAQRQGAGLMTIKTVSRRNWPEGDTERYATWYEPFDDQERITAAVAWVLSHREITGIPTAGDVRLLPLLIRAEQESATMSAQQAAQVLDRAEEYSSPFVAMPI
jgi:hypothetical protein